MLLQCLTVNGTPTRRATCHSFVMLTIVGASRAGIDGNWSTFYLSVGEPAQPVHVLASTVLSEFWVVGDGGCSPGEPHCQDARGGLFHPEKSAHWSDIGIWSLGLDHLGYPANGEYGLDLLEFQGAQNDAAFSMKSTLIAGLNTTVYFLGYFGLGSIQTNFDRVVVNAPITQAAESSGLIPSYTYGYTAGAHYLNTPASLTLGGYDAARFDNHDDQFILGSDDDFPWAQVRGIQVSTQGNSELASEWNSSTMILSNYTNSFAALVDSTTPFLWLPPDACDAFASALNLTYSNTFDLYTLTNEQYESLRAADAYEFVFSLSSLSNNDDFGDPLNVPGVVNITIPSRALVGTLEYPYMEELIGYSSPAVPYFALRKSSMSTIIGRSFMQEAYILTNYDTMTYSIHQARFPEDPEADMDIVVVGQQSDGPLPSPEPAPEIPESAPEISLSPGALGGIVAGSIVGAVLAVVAFSMWRRRRRNAKRNQASSSECDLEEKYNSSSSTTETQQVNGSPVARLVNRFIPRGLFQKKKSASVNEQGAPSEVPNHEIFELPCPIQPAELNGDGDDGDSEVVYGYDTRHMGAYEQACRRLDRQLAGPVPEYSPPSSDQMPRLEKELSKDQGPPSTDFRDFAPVSPPASDINYSHSPNGSAPSPLSPRVPSSECYPLPRVATAGPRSSTKSATWGRSIGLALTNQTRSDSSSAPISPSHIALPPSPRFQRTPIDPSNVVYLGILPDQEHQTSRPPTPEILHPDGRPVNPSDTLASADTDAGSFNSSFAGEDEIRWHLRLQEEARLAALAAMRDAYPEAPPDVEWSTLDSHRRWSLQTEHFERNHDPATWTANQGMRSGGEYLDLAAGLEFVHVPQLPHRRYSWEEED